MNAEVVLTPAEIALLPRRDLAGTTCVVFDVLRATSTILNALSNGARSVYPVRTIEEARQLRSERLPDALLGGERNGVRIEGFDLGNSPREYTREKVAGRDLITTTTNGTVALQACVGAREVLAGALVNLGAVTAYLCRPEAITDHLLLVCAGTDTRFALEDGFAAGALLARLDSAGRLSACNDAGLAMFALFQRSADGPGGALHGSENGQRLLRSEALAPDVNWCARIDAVPRVAILRDGALTTPPAVDATSGYV